MFGFPGLWRWSRLDRLLVNGVLFGLVNEDREEWEDRGPGVVEDLVVIEEVVRRLLGCHLGLPGLVAVLSLTIGPEISEGPLLFAGRPEEYVIRVVGDVEGLVCEEVVIRSH